MKLTLVHCAAIYQKRQYNTYMQIIMTGLKIQFSILYNDFENPTFKNQALEIVWLFFALRAFLRSSFLKKILHDTMDCVKNTYTKKCTQIQYCQFFKALHEYFISVRVEASPCSA